MAAQLPAADEASPCPGEAVGGDLFCEPRDYRPPYQLGHPSADTNTLPKNVQKLGEPLAAAQWRVAAWKLYIPS